MATETPPEGDTEPVQAAPPVTAAPTTDDLLAHELREPTATVAERRVRYRVAASPDPRFAYAVVDTADHDRPLAFCHTLSKAKERAARWNEKGHPAAALVEGQREFRLPRPPELPGATQGATSSPDTPGDADAAPVAPAPHSDDDKGSLVVSLPDGWRVIGTPIQWIVERGQKSGGWRRAAWHVTRDSMIRQLPERLWGPRSGKALPDDVLAVLRALPATHAGDTARRMK